MEANELRIGNLTLLNGVINEVSQTDFEQWTFDNMQPIPLTPEILERCGFEYDSIEWPSAKVWVCKQLPLDKKYYVALQQKAGFTLWYRPANLKVKYLHQLQNLYFALTGTELEIKNLVEV